MKTNKSIVGFSVILALACLYQLSFTWKARNFESQARSFAQKQAKLGFSEKEMYRRYIDSLGNKEFYNLGIANYTYFECKQREINLGLDLRGGMNVILEVDKGAIIKGLANDNKDAGLLKAIAATDNIIRNEGGDYVEVFMEQFKKANPDRKPA
ncbi:MAG: protein translocase subunit SecDF, partial [Bacteroidia bacterium]